MRRSKDTLKQAFLETATALAAAIEAKDPVTGCHGQRVAELAVGLARAVGVRDGELDGIYVGAVLHDIGKIAIPTEILMRPHPLNEEEWALIKRHPLDGARIISSVQFPWDVKPIIVQHHERFNGTGYPAGLRGEEIVLFARIFAVVDAFEAMTADRPYRRAMPEEKALDEITGNAGTQFDPDIASTFVELRRSEAVARRAA
ncbi:MAG: HD-GYP domain-containing protein [Chloroflexi bacterium]|nr:HD-GYP domain-containing protein [Chloroflexota bacterium]